MGRPAIIPVAGGKGGIGKTIIAANIAVTIARNGHQVVAVDLDLGGSNLHAILGVRNSERNIVNFATGDAVSLDEMAVPTRFPNTRIICGAANIAGAADIPPNQKMRIIHNIEALDCDYVILDLGGGSSFNVTDFFLTGEQGVIVIVPEITSILDAYSFLKTTLYRKLQMEWQHEPQVRVLIEEFRNPKNQRNLLTIEDLLREVGHINEEFEQSMRVTLAGYGVRVVLNKVRNKKDFQVIRTIAQLAKNNLGLAVYNAGYVPFDTSVEQSVNKMMPFVSAFPHSPASAQIASVARALLAGRAA